MVPRRLAFSFSLLSVVSLCLCLTPLLHGQAALTLLSNPNRVRADGITEQVGLLTLSNSTGTAQAIPATTVITVVFDGIITNGSSTLNRVGLAGFGGLPSGNVYTTGLGSSTMPSIGGSGSTTAFTTGNTLTITIPATYGNDGTGVCDAFTPPASTTTLCIVPGGALNIQGLRVNVTGISGNVNATVTTTPAGAVVFAGGINSASVGLVTATIGSVTVTTAASLTQCFFPVTPSTLPSATFVPASGSTATVRVVETASFPSAFTSAADEAAITPTSLQGSAPVPTRGVQVVFNFSGLPAGVTLLAPESVVGTTGSSTTQWSLVITGTTLPVPSPTTYRGFAASGGLATIAYEVISTTSGSASTVDQISFPFSFTAPSGTVIPLGIVASVNASVGPVSVTTGFSTTASQIRFVANAGVGGGAAGATTACFTNLLFPFVSNRSTFNTGLIVANTALDAGTTTGETGGVTVRYFGVIPPTGGSAGIPLPIPSVASGGTVATVGVIAPGEHTTALLSSIAPGFQGYLVMTCNFRYAHGSSFLIDGFGIGPPSMTFALGALVMNGTTTTRSGALNAPTPGETLGH